MDVKSSFLCGDIEEEIYMRQCKRYTEYSSLVYKLRKCLCGIKQAPRAWYYKMDAFLLSQKFERYKYDYNVYMQYKERFLLVIILCVDNLLITNGSTVGLRGIKSSLSESFSITDLGLLRKFISLEVNKKYLGIMITQSRYIGDLFKIFHIIDCKEGPFPFLSGIRLEQVGSIIHTIG